jgi:hypothetical protein
LTPHFFNPNGVPLAIEVELVVDEKLVPKLTAGVVLDRPKIHPMRPVVHRD